MHVTSRTCLTQLVSLAILTRLVMEQLQTCHVSTRSDAQFGYTFLASNWFFRASPAKATFWVSLALSTDANFIDTVRPVNVCSDPPMQDIASASLSAVLLPPESSSVSLSMSPSVPPTAQDGSYPALVPWENVRTPQGLPFALSQLLTPACAFSQLLQQETVGTQGPTLVTISLFSLYGVMPDAQPGDPDAVSHTPGAYQPLLYTNATFGTSDSPDAPVDEVELVVPAFEAPVQLER